MDFVTGLAERTEQPVRRILGWLRLQPGKFYSWRERYGRANEHNGKIPRDHWIEAWEREEIIRFRAENPLEGYRRLAFMMLDKDRVAVSPATVFRVLRSEGLLDRWNRKSSKKGTGFHQPSRPHEHWHVDIAYVNAGGTFYYLCSVVDGYSRFVVHWEVRPAMKEADVETIIQRAVERFPEAKPRIITDNGSQFVAKDFKIFIREAGMTHVRTSPYYPQSNGKVEAWNKTVKVEAIRPASPTTMEEVIALVGAQVERYNHVRLHSAIGWVTPADKLAGRENEIWTARDIRLEAAREARRKRRECA
ncbi:MAG: IS3 family transposase [Candidatus Eisenbacteria bacterium]